MGFPSSFLFFSYSIPSSAGPFLSCGGSLVGVAALGAAGGARSTVLALVAGLLLLAGLLTELLERNG